MKYLVVWEDRYEPCEYETECNEQSDAVWLADRVRDDGGYADVFAEDGEEPIY